MLQHYSIRMNGFLGDQLIQTSVAKALKNKDPNCKVEFTNVRPQLLLLLSKVPFIDNITPHLNSDWGHNDIMFDDHNHKYTNITLPLYDNRSILPTLFHQRFAGIEFQYQERDFKLDLNLSNEKNRDNVFRVGVPLDWELKSFDYTLEEYEKGIDVPNLGYGGKHRNIDNILSEISTLTSHENVELVRLGLGYGHPLDVATYEQAKFESDTYYHTACKIADCDLVIGSEGGLTNLANALGVPTHTTTDFQMQLYGWNGVLEKTEMDKSLMSLASPMGVKLGPFQFDQSGIHTWSVHYATDEEIAIDIVKRIKGIMNGY